MIEINLLPWRESAPLFSIRQWLLLLGVFILGISLFYVKYHTVSALPISPQQGNPVAIHPEPSESITWQKMRFAGYLRQGGVMWGLIQFPNGAVQEVKIGDLVGVHGAHVKSIAHDHLVIELKNQHQRVLRGY